MRHRFPMEPTGCAVKSKCIHCGVVRWTLRDYRDAIMAQLWQRTVLKSEWTTLRPACQPTVAK